MICFYRIRKGLHEWRGAHEALHLARETHEIVQLYAVVSVA